MAHVSQPLQAVADVWIQLREADRESNARRRMNDGSLKEKRFGRYIDREVADLSAFWRYRKAALDIAPKGDETADAGVFFSPRTRPGAVEIPYDAWLPPTVPIPQTQGSAQS